MWSELYDKRGDIGAFFAALSTEITKIGLIKGVRPPGILICETLRDSYYVRLHTIPSLSVAGSRPFLRLHYAYFIHSLLLLYIRVILRFKTSVFRLMSLVCGKCFVSLLVLLESCWLFVTTSKVTLKLDFISRMSSFRLNIPFRIFVS